MGTRFGQVAVLSLPPIAKENAMRKFAVVLAVCAITLFGMAASAQGRARNASGQIVIVFKDGHRQAFNYADIARIEFPGGSPVADAGPTPPGAPPRGHFIGKWEVGDGGGNTFYITLNEDSSAWRSLGMMHGKWAYINGEARVTWDDGAQDCIRRTKGHDQKFAYRGGKSFTDEPDNVTDARNTTPRPI
jgi:hypothetical protein